MVPSVGDLRAELDALADASVEALARLREGDEAGVADMLERRERLLELLTGGPLEADTAALIDAARRALALDGDIVESLRARQLEVRRELQRLMHARQSLQSYGASREGSALYVQRLG
jgi:hypothetical protein